MRQNFLHLDFKGVTPVASRFPEWLKFFRALGYDGIMFELDCKYPWQTWPGATRDQYTKEEVLFILEEARKCGFQVSLLVQSIGHLDWALQYPQYAHLRENGFVSELCPSHPESLGQIKRWIDEALSLCPDMKYMHLGADEAHHLCSCPECLRCAAADPQGDMGVYLKHVGELCRYVAAKGIRPLIWSDMFLSHHNCAVLKELPRETILVNWRYHELPPFPGTNEFAESGLEVWGAPAIRCGWPDDCWGSVRREDGVACRVRNIRDWQQTGLTLLNTAWGRPSNFVCLYPPYHAFLDAFRASGHNVVDMADFPGLAREEARWKKIAGDFDAMRWECERLYHTRQALLTTNKYIGELPGLLHADCTVPARALAKRVDAWQQEVRQFFADNGLTDGEEFAAARASVLTPAVSMEFPEI